MSLSIAGAGGASSPQMVSGASPYSSPSTKMTNLFQTIDTGNTGSISQQQFNNAFATLNPPGRFQSLGASSIFSKLDPQGTGSVSQSAFVSGMTKLFSPSGNAGTSGTSAVTSSASLATPSQSLSQSQQSLDLLGTQISTTSVPGSVVNKLI